MKKVNILTGAALSFLLIGTLFTAVAHGEKGLEKSAEHKNIVADVAQELKDIAGKDKNIGEEVRAVAQEQEASGERAAEAMKKVETRGGFKTFLFGTDYKNIGALRSEIVTTENHIDRLTKARDRTADAEVKAGLDAQIAELEEANAAARAFIQENESKFSVFGWFIKLFQ